MPTAMRYFLEISLEGARCEGKIYRDQPRGDAFSLQNLELGPEVRLPGRPYTLGKFCRDLVALDPKFRRELDERFLLDIGSYLYDQTFGQIRFHPSERRIEVQVVTHDEHIARLPWVLLAHDGIFLAANDWSVSLTRFSEEQKTCELPPSPKMLVVMPEPEGYSSGADKHLAELEAMLSAADRYLKRGHHIRVATTWEDLSKVLKDFKPDLLYFYGHGTGDTSASDLIFAEGPEGRTPRKISVIDFAQCLREAGLEDLLLFAYINCCQGDAGGLLGVGWQLDKLVPAVVTNRTVAEVKAAQLQAKDLFEALLLRGEAPHEAVAGMFNRLGDMGLSFGDPRWMTPVLHRQYRDWKAATPPVSTIEDPYWRVRLDRIKQCGQVFLETTQMLRRDRRRPRCLAYLWYGKEDQGVDRFYERLQVDLQELLQGCHLQVVTPRWPDFLGQSPRPFSDMFEEAFEVLDLNLVPGKIRTSARSTPEGKRLVFVRHNPLRREGPIRARDMKRYLEWWNAVFCPLLKEAGAFALLGISFVSREPQKLRDFLKETLADLDLAHVAVHVLDEMERLSEEDLRDFLRAHEVLEVKDEELKRILAITQGVYEPTLRALQDLFDRLQVPGNDVAEERVGPAADDPDW